MSAVSEVLGEERIREICQEFGLGSKEEGIVNEILERWDQLVGDPLEKVRVAQEIIKDNPYFLQIALALKKINFEFAMNLH